MIFLDRSIMLIDIICNDSLYDELFECLHGFIYFFFIINQLLTLILFYLFVSNFHFFHQVRKNKFVEILPINVGCLGACTYCKTKHARGHLGSYTVDSLVSLLVEIKTLLT